MKKLILLAIFFSSLFLHADPPQLTWRIANPRIIRVTNLQRLEFEVQVKANQAGSYYSSGQFMLYFNNDAISYSPSTNWTVIRSGISAQKDPIEEYKYITSRVTSGAYPNVKVLIALSVTNEDVIDNDPSADFLAEITTEWQTYIKVQCQITDVDALAGIYFDEAGTNGQNFYLASAVNEVGFNNPSLYESLTLSQAYLGRIYSNSFGWTQYGGTTNNVPYINWATAVNTTIFDGNATITQTNNTAALANNLNIMDGANLTLETNKWLTVAGTLNTPNSDALIINDGGSLIHHSTAVDATLKRNLTGGSLNTTTHRYHLVSVPMAASSVYNASDLFTGFHLWEFDALNQGWLKITDNNFPILNQEGYLVWHDQPSRSFEIAGRLNGSDYLLPIKNVGTYTDGQSYRLIPNPYPSALEWSTPAGYDAAVYFYNGATGNYLTFADGVPSPAIVPYGQSFFVKTSVPGGIASAITISNSSRSHNNQSFYKSSTSVSNLLQIKVNSELSEDYAYLRFLEGATNLFDPDKDARKLFGFGDAPQLYSSYEGINYAINTLEMTNNPTVVPLHFTMSMDGMVNMELSNLESFAKGVSVFLEDVFLNKLVNINEQPVYSFTHQQNSPEDRFKLHFHSALGIETIDSETINIYSSGKKIYIQLPQINLGNTSVEIFDQMGRTIYMQSHAQNNPIIINAMDFPHCLITRVKTARQAKTSKLIIQ